MSQLLILINYTPIEEDTELILYHHARNLRPRSGARVGALEHWGQTAKLHIG